MKEQNSSLEAKVKELEQKLTRLDEDKQAAQAPTRSTLKRSVTDFFGNAIDTPPKRGNRRRSTSLNNNDRVSELEAEIAALRSASGGSGEETDKLRTQLTAAKRELDKATNAKLALERSSQRALDELKSQLEDSNFELEDWRRNDGSGGKAELEKVKSTARAQHEAASAQIIELQATVKAKEEAILQLEQQLERVFELEIALEEERSRPTVSSAVDTEETSSLRAKIASLESDLAGAKTSAPAAIVPDRSVRQLQRENKTLQTQVSSLNDEIASLEDELYRLRGAIPLPQSPALNAADAIAQQERITELQMQLEDAGEEVSKIRAALADAEQKNREQSAQLSVSYSTAAVSVS